MDNIVNLSLKLFGLLFLFPQLCYAQTKSKIIGTSYSNEIDNIAVLEFSPKALDQKFHYYPTDKGDFQISFNNEQPEIIRVFNSYILVLPNDSLHLNILNSKREFEVNGLNHTFLNLQKKDAQFELFFWKKFQYVFSAKEYLFQIDSLVSNNMISIEESIQSVQGIKALENYFNSYKLFLYSLPFISEAISLDEKKIMVEEIEKTILNYSDSSINNRNELFDIGLSNFYIHWVYKNDPELAGITNTSYWNKSADLRRNIAGQLIKAYADNSITLNETVLSLIKNILCGSSEENDDFCDYYISKTEYANLSLVAISKGDSLMKPARSIISLGNYLNNKNTAIYLWASWCAPCVEFLKTLDLKKINELDSSPVIFISLDESFDAWEQRNKQLGMPKKYNCLMKKGFKSSFISNLKIDHVPFTLEIKQNKVKRFNVKSEVFKSFFLTGS